MKGFIISPTYRIKEDKAYVELYGRLENGESFLTINEFKPYFLIEEKDLEKAKKILKKLTLEKTDFTTKDGEKVVKIIFTLPADVPKARKQLTDKDIEVYESDIKFPYRFMMDRGLQSTLAIEGTYEKGERVNRIYTEPTLTSASYIPTNLKVLSFDIESGKTQDDELYCIGFHLGSLKKVFLNSKTPVEGAISCENEKEVLEQFIREINILDPDIITGWNIIDFDLAYLNNKCKKYKIPLDIGREEGKIKLTLRENFFQDSKAEVTGRQVLDALNLLRVSFIKVDDYKLDTVARKIVGETKLITTTGKEKYQEIDDLFKNNKKKLIAYNLKDAELVLKIIEKSDILNLTIQRSLLTGMPLDRVNASIASLDSLYIREARKRKLVAPSAKFAVKEEQTLGGYVREAVSGIYDYVLILDFKSLYPSIIRTFNIDPLSFVEDCKGKNLIKAPNGACFKNENGILPSVIEELWKHREIARKEKNELARHAIKIQMNSFYGSLASPACRFFNPDIANAITHFGHAIIKLTSEKIEKMGYKVIYNDTDSNFVVSNAKTSEEAEKIGKKIEKEINAFYKDFVKKEYKRESYLELAFDKVFIKCLMPKVRGGEKGAKKRYAGLLLKEGKEEIQFVGMETVRSDWTDLAKQYQQEIYERIFHNKEITDYTKKLIQDLKKGKYDSLLVYRKNIRKDLKDYTKSTPPHVKAARQLEQLDSDIIEYVITEEGPEPIQKIRHKLDYQHYIDKQIKPLADTVLLFFNTNFDDLLKENKQTTLF